jgi:hypothetical protein
MRQAAIAGSRLSGEIGRTSTMTWYCSENLTYGWMYLEGVQVDHLDSVWNWLLKY